MSRRLRNGPPLAVLLTAGAIALAGCESDDERPAAAPADQQDHAGHEMAGAQAEVQQPQPVHLTDEQAVRLGVTFARAEVRSLSKTIRTVGYVTAAESRMHWLAPKVGGWVERLYVDFTGDWVRKGQPLLELYSPELVTAQEELILARNLQGSLASSSIAEVREAADTLLNSARQRLRYWDISEEQIREIEQTGEVRKTLTLESPWSGIVMEKKVLSGSAIRAGQPLYMIADLSEVWIETEFYEADLAVVSEGQQVEVSVAAYPGEGFTGRLEYVYPTLEERTRTLRARVAVRNPRNRLKPGLYATVRLNARVADSALVVPTSAVVQTGERQVVFVVSPDGMLEPRSVTLGQRADDWIVVLDGLETGARVVNSATFLIDSESNLGSALAAMAGHAGHGGAGETSDGN